MMTRVVHVSRAVDDETQKKKNTKNDKKKKKKTTKSSLHQMKMYNIFTGARQLSY